MEKKYHLRDVAKIIGISRTSIYKAVRRHKCIGEHTLGTDAKGKLVLTEEGVNILKQMYGIVPQDTESVPHGTTRHSPQMKQEIIDLRRRLDETMEMVRKLHEQIRERDQRTDTIIMNLTNQIGRLSEENLRLQLEYHPKKIQEEDAADPSRSMDIAPPKNVPESSPTVVKSQVRQPHPKESWGWFKRVWVELFHPELLRESCLG